LALLHLHVIFPTQVERDDSLFVDF
jgi:hypothetical protein